MVVVPAMTRKSLDADADKVTEIVNSICPLLAGQKPEVQSAALADLLAMWVAGHFVPGDEAATSAAREDLLNDHMKLVQELVGINAR
jgi:hypothetical protein